MNQNNEKTYFFSYNRKGISTEISEQDKLGSDVTSGAVERPFVQLSMNVKATPVSVDKETKKTIVTKEVKNFSIVGPGDVLSVNSDAVMNVYPPAGSDSTPKSHLPYIEFCESDFAWRYTPAAANGVKLRPWLAIVVCETSKCQVEKNDLGTDVVTFNLTNESEYNSVFPIPSEIWKSAHAQGSCADGPDFCRLVFLKRKNEPLQEKTDYSAFLIPVFEVGRLRGLNVGDDALKDVFAQQSSWEGSLSEQKKRIKPLSFPSYYTWAYKTGEDSFSVLVEKLSGYNAEKSGITVDVSAMGEGLSYSVLTESVPKKTNISVPAATKTVDYCSAPAFPSGESGSDEREVYRNLKDLLSKSPVFSENKGLIGHNTISEDDPWVTPPIYGGKHIMATSLDGDKDNVVPEWFKQVNLDLHYRTVAGLGKKVVQEHQEQFVNRAWKQIDLVKSLNNDLYQRLLSANVDSILKNQTYGGAFKKSIVKNPSSNNQISDSEFIQNLLMNLSSMQNTDEKKDFSISQILKNRGISKAFASNSFKRIAEQVSAICPQLNVESLLKNITLGQSSAMRSPKDCAYYSASDLDISSSFLYLADKIVAERPSLNMAVGDKSSAYSILDFYSIKKNLEYKDALSTVKFGDSVGKNILTALLLILLVGGKFFEFVPVTRKMADMQTICAYYSEKRSVSLHLIPYTRSGGASKYTLSAYGQMRQLFLSSSFVLMPCYGFTISGDTKYPIERLKGRELGDVIGLKTLIFKSIFGDRYPIVKLFTSEGYVYFADYETLFEKRKTDSVLKNAVKFYAMPDCEKSFDESKIKDLDIKPFDSVLSAYTRDCDESTIEAMNKTPDFITLKADELSNYIKDIFGPIIWTNEIIEKYKDADLTQMPIGCLRGFLTHSRMVNKLKAMSESIKVAEENKVKTEQEKNQSLDDLYRLQNELNECRAMNASQQKVVENFSVEFSGNETLKKKYVDDLLSSRYPVMAYPIFPEPTYFYLKQLSDKFILPCVDELPEDSVTVFASNESFVEAYLCGMNTEMGRELLWREYPTDQRGSYFKKFWDFDTSVKDVKNDTFFDVKSVHTWNGQLGENHNDSKTGLLMFAIKGKLMKNYPDTQIYLHKAALNTARNGFDLVAESSENSNVVLKPVAQAFFRDDIYVVGFKISLADAIGSPSSKSNHGYMLMFKQEVENINFDSSKIGGTTSNSAQFACKLIEKTHIYGKHVLTFTR